MRLSQSTTFALLNNNPARNRDDLHQTITVSGSVTTRLSPAESDNVTHIAMGIRHDEPLGPCDAFDTPSLVLAARTDVDAVQSDRGQREDNVHPLAPVVAVRPHDLPQLRQSACQTSQSAALLCNVGKSFHECRDVNIGFWRESRLRERPLSGAGLSHPNVRVQVPPMPSRIHSSLWKLSPWT